MDDEFRKRRRRVDIQAVHWDGSNHDEVRRFFAKCGLDPVDGPYFSSKEDIARFGYNVVTANVGDFEADKDTWISYDEDLDEYDSDHPEWFERIFDCS